MGLSNSQYQAILREYDRIQAEERAKREEKRNTRIAIEATRRSREQRNKIKQLEEEISKERSRRESIAGARRNKK